MRLALKLNAIEQEHLQELYDAAGVARDELPYCEQFDQLCRDFQDRTFKNADREQVFGALLKYVRSSTCPSKEKGDSALDAEQVKHLKTVLKRQGKAGRLLPFSSEYDAALKDFNASSGLNLTERDFWMANCKTQSRSRRPPKPKSAAKPDADDDSDDDV